MGLFKAEGFVLRTRDLGEADKILTLFTRERGKVAAVAKGARRARSRLLATSQVFSHGRFLIYEGRSLHTVSQAELISSFRPLREDLSRMAYASYVAELIDAFVDENEPHVALFRTVLEAFTLMAGTSDLEMGVRWFELQLLDRLGYRPEFARCVACDREITSPRVLFHPAEGGVLCAACTERAAGGVEIPLGITRQCIRLLENPAAPLGILRPSPSDRRIMESLLRAHIDHRLDRPIKSRDFLEAMRSLGPDEDRAEGEKAGNDAHAERAGKD